jgi:hypothetical protein
MFTQTFSPLKAVSLLVVLSTSFLTSQAQSNNYLLHFKGADSVVTLAEAGVPNNHLQAEISQPEKGVMKFRVAISNPGEKKITLTIRRGSEDLFFQVIHGSESINMYNMEGLDDGNYVVEISAGKDKILRNIVLSTVTEVNRQANIH